MKKHYHVVAAVIERNDKILIAQRADKGELAKKWEFPGGKIEESETHQQALSREIKEELDIDISVDDYITTVNYAYNTFDLTMYAYKCTVNNGEIRLNEHLGYAWVEKLDLMSYDLAAADIPIVDMIIKEKK